MRGIELSAAGNITKDWSVFGGLVLLDTEVLKSDPLNPQDVGRRLGQHSADAVLAACRKYQLTDQLALGGTATYGGEVYAGHLAANASNNHTVDWWRFDAFAEYELTKNIEIEISASTSRMSCTTMRSIRHRALRAQTTAHSPSSRRAAPAT